MQLLCVDIYAFLYSTHLLDLNVIKTYEIHLLNNIGKFFMYEYKYLIIYLSLINNLFLSFNDR